MVIIVQSIFPYLREIVILNLKTFVFQQSIAEKLNLKTNDPRFREIITVLRQNMLCEEEHYWANTKKIKILNNKLDDFIRENCEEFKRWGKFIETNKIGYNY